MSVRIAVDAMGGDNAPHEIVAGALMAAGGLGCDLVLVGQQAAILHELEGTAEIAGLRVVSANDVIRMDDSIDAVRGRPEASINVGLRLVKDGEADAFVTAGNTGATMAAALLSLGRVKGIARPALATIFPTATGSVCIYLDVGANADCRPQHLVQFAHMGAGYMQRMFDVREPRVCLLSIGEEDTKGSQLVVETNGLLRGSRLNFIGNIEGRDLMQGVCDVAVMDGFTGNVVLKTVEGMAELMFNELRTVVERTPWNRAAGLILMSELRSVRRRLDYTEYGGAQLLGVDGVVVIGHGRSNARAVFSAIKAARDAVQNGVLDVVRSVAQEIPAKRGREDAAGDVDR
jgi:glycerol-3-phosphate acyltransferase PlsX